jgi:ribonuclease HII
MLQAEICSAIMRHFIFLRNLMITLGIDEVGKGCVAGDIVVCGFLTKNQEEAEKISLLSEQSIIKDSKKLSEKKLKTAYDHLIQTNCVFYLASRTAQEIDQFGIDKCWEYCSNYSIIIDGNRLIGVLKKRDSAKAIVKADDLYPQVMAASIVAKITRDNQMVELSKIYPGYDFENNVGYLSKNHKEGIKKLGKCFIHRKSFKIKELV